MANRAIAKIETNLGIVEIPIIKCVEKKCNNWLMDAPMANGSTFELCESHRDRLENEQLAMSRANKELG